MADQENKPGAPIPSGEDTQTRKTVKLKAPSTPAASIGGGHGGGGIADPLSGRDTDTGNLDVLSDTQTRKTVKLKPIAPLEKNPPPHATPSTVTLPDEPGRPMTASPAAAAPPAPAEDETVKVKKVEAPITPTASFKDDATVKLKRPEKNGLAGIRPAAKVEESKAAPAAPAPAPAPAKPALAPQTNIAAPDLKKPITVVKKETVPAAPAAAETPAPEAAPAEAAPEAAPEAPAAEEPKGKRKKEKPSLGLKSHEDPGGRPPMVAEIGEELSGKKKRRSGPGTPSPAYTVIAVLTLVCLIATAVITVVHHLNFNESHRLSQPIRLPVLSDQVK